MKYTKQDLKDEYEQAIKRKGKLYAEGYVEGLKDAQNKALTIHSVVVSDFCECEGVQDLHAMTGECRKCGNECTY